MFRPACRPLVTTYRVAGRSPIAVANCPLSSRQGSFWRPSQSRSITNVQKRETAVPSSEGTLYTGPLAQTYRRLKIFSVASFSLSCTLAPFMFIVESSLPTTARVALMSIALGTSGISTALIGWCGKPYVETLRYLRPEENGGSEGIQMTTYTLLLQPRITTVYDPAFLVETKRALAKWELTNMIVLPDDKTVIPGVEETVAETADKDGRVLGRWIVKWEEGGKGSCHEIGTINKYFNVHEELLQ